MPDTETNLTITNGDIWLATQPAEPGQRSALVAILKVPTAVTEVRNGSALARAVDAALTDIIAARNAALDHLCPVISEDGPTKQYGVTQAFIEAEAKLFAEVVVLQNVRPMKISAFAQGARVSPEDVRRCGPLLID